MLTQNTQKVKPIPTRKLCYRKDYCAMRRQK